MNKYKKYLPYFLIISIFIISFIIWYSIRLLNGNSSYLEVAFLDVGQGDAIYIEAPNGKQVLIDTGPSAVTLSHLSKQMSFADRSIDIIIITNPDQDHIGGAIDIINRYKVGMILLPGTIPDTTIYRNLESEIKNHNIKKVIAIRGTKIMIDDKRNIYMDILFPDQDVSGWETNEASIVGKLIYNKESFMLMGDASKYTENLIDWNEDDEYLKSNILKIGHHGSKTSSSELWLEKVDPSIAIISVGKDNRYGHPSTDVIERLKRMEIPYLLTSIEGDIILRTDGENLIKK